MRAGSARLSSPGMRCKLLGIATIALGCSNQLKSGDAIFELPEPGLLTAGKTAQPAAQFGYEVAVHGTSVLAAAPYETVFDVAERGGAAYLFERQSGEWHTTRLQTPNVGPGDGVVESPPAPEFGAISEFGSLRVQFDDELVVVGVAGEDSGRADDPTDNNVENAGAVYVYQRAHLQDAPTYLKAPDINARGSFGLGLSLSDSWLAVGAPGTHNPQAPASGAVYVYERSPRGLGNPRRVTAPAPGVQDLFGTWVVVSDDLLAVGAPHEDSESTGVGGDQTNDRALGMGAVFVYRWRDGDWKFEEYLKPSNRTVLSGFGTSLSVSGDVLAVGAPGASSCGEEHPTRIGWGAVYVFRRDAGGWHNHQCLSPAGNDVQEAFGWRVSLLNDRLLAGAPWDSEREPCDPTAPKEELRRACGAAYLFTVDDVGRWGLPETIYPPDPLGGGAVFGEAVGLSSELMLIGAPGQSAKTGALYVYPPPP
jgi:hypothetical protein